MGKDACDSRVSDGSDGGGISLVCVVGVGVGRGGETEEAICVSFASCKPTSSPSYQSYLRAFASIKHLTDNPHVVYANTLQ